MQSKELSVVGSVFFWHYIGSLRYNSFIETDDLLLLAEKRSWWTRNIHFQVEFVSPFAEVGPI